VVGIFKILLVDQWRVTKKLTLTVCSGVVEQLGNVT